MNPHADQSVSPISLVKSLWCHRRLILQMTWRDVIGRYKGSVMGLVWSFVNPLMMLAIYTFVFSVVFKARWGVETSESKIDFGITLFVGLVMYSFFAECINRAPGLIISNVNYVKKVIFPLEILPCVALGVSLFHSVISLGVLVFIQLVFNHYIPLTAVFFPLLLLPLVFGTIGVAWFLAAIGVYLRDIDQVIVVFTTALLFVSAVFFPITALPERYQIFLRVNPLAILIEEGRKVLIFGQLPNFTVWSVLLVLGALTAWGGFAWFQKARKGFADVI